MQKYDAPLSAAPASHRIEAGGLDIHYLRAGRGRPLVLLHGWPEFSGVWEPMMARLASEFDVIAPDLRGFGDTQKPDAGPSEAVSADLLAADLLALLDGLGLEGPVGLVSHDVGASVAQSLGRSHPERISGLFFFNCPYPGIGTRWARRTTSARSGTTASTACRGRRPWLDRRERHAGNIFRTSCATGPPIPAPSMMRWSAGWITS